MPSPRTRTAVYCVRPRRAEPPVAGVGGHIRRYTRGINLVADWSNCTSHWSGLNSTVSTVYAHNSIYSNTAHNKATSELCDARRLCDTIRHPASAMWPHEAISCGGRELHESRETWAASLTHNQLPPPAPPPRLTSPPSRLHEHFQPPPPSPSAPSTTTTSPRARPSASAQMALRGAAPRAPAVPAWRAHGAW